MPKSIQKTEERVKKALTKMEAFVKAHQDIIDEYKKLREELKSAVSMHSSNLREFVKNKDYSSYTDDLGFTVRKYAPKEEIDLESVIDMIGWEDASRYIEAVTIYKLVDEHAADRMVAEQVISASDLDKVTTRTPTTPRVYVPGFIKEHL